MSFVNITLNRLDTKQVPGKKALRLAGQSSHHLQFECSVILYEDAQKMFFKSSIRNNDADAVESMLQWETLPKEVFVQSCPTDEMLHTLLREYLLECSLELILEGYLLEGPYTYKGTQWSIPSVHHDVSIELPKCLDVSPFAS